ncbi:MAG: type III-B CRISPR module-associated protein Cmr5 [Candidatus Nezhaarchaeales archaeon]
MSKDLLADAYNTAWKYVELLKKINSNELIERVRSYAERFASYLERDGVLPTLMFMASKSSWKVRKELGKGLEGVSEVKLDDVRVEEYAHSILYECYVSWLVRRGLIPREDYEEDSLNAVVKLATEFDRPSVKAYVMNELSRIAIAFKHVVVGEFGGGP